MKECFYLDFFFLDTISKIWNYFENINIFEYRIEQNSESKFEDTANQSSLAAKYYIQKVILGTVKN